MASLFRPNISTYQLPGGKHRTPDGKRVTKNTPGAVKVTKRSKVFYGRYRNAKGDTITAPLCGNKTAAQQILAKLVTDAARPKITWPILTLMNTARRLWPITWKPTANISKPAGTAMSMLRGHWRGVEQSLPPAGSYR